MGFLSRYRTARKQSRILRKAIMTAPAPSNPIVNSITFDQPVYAPGQLMTVTVDYSPGTADQTQTFTGTATDANNRIGQLVVNFIVLEPVPTTASASDSGNRTWTKVSDSNGVAVFTATA